MTNRHVGYVVTLDKSIREDDAELVINALRMVRGVVDVSPVVDNFELSMAREAARRELRAQVFELFG